MGRQPKISLAEIESLYGESAIEPLNYHSALINIASSKIMLEQLGGSVKLCTPIDTLSSTNWADISNYISSNLNLFLKNTSAKVTLGLSVYGINISSQKINSTSLELKRIIKNKLGIAVRIVPNSGSYLSSAQVIHNKLNKENSIELVFCISKNKTIIAKTIKVQDIYAYSSRDQKRPARDSKVGMLPPKLAQIIVNLATGQNKPKILLDPFCGTGVILQEAYLSGLEPYGTDIDERMVRYSNENISWLLGTTNNFKINQADATEHKWDSFDVLASETYLGQPFSTEPNQIKLNKVIQDVNTILKKFLKNLTLQTKPGLRICIAIPTWFTKNGIKHLPIIDQLSYLGYTQMSFVYAKKSDLIYHRENQIVGRELLVLIRK